MRGKRRTFHQARDHLLVRGAGGGGRESTYGRQEAGRNRRLPLGGGRNTAIARDSISLQSAGAVVIARTPGGLRLALLHRGRPGEWRLPKGKLKEGESHREAARREVREELGVVVEIGERIGETCYGYEQGGRKFSKTVVFYLACLPEPVILTPEASTFDEARWVAPAEALRLLTWENEQQMVQQALQAVGEPCAGLSD